MVWHQLSTYSPPLVWGLVNSVIKHLQLNVTTCACSSNQSVCKGSIGYDQLLFRPHLNSVDVHDIAHNMVNGSPRCWYADSLRYPCLWINFTEQSLHLYSLQVEHHRRATWPWVLFVSVTLQRRQQLIMPIKVLHMFISRMATWCSLFYGAVPLQELMLHSTRKQWTLQCLSSKTLSTSHFVRLWYCVVSNITF